MDIDAAFDLASVRAAAQFPHGTTDADALAGILRTAITDIQSEPETPASLLRDFVAWRDRAQDGDSGCDYLNGDMGSETDGWTDLDEIAERARTVLAAMGGLK